MNNTKPDYFLTIKIIIQMTKKLIVLTVVLFCYTLKGQVSYNYDKNLLVEISSYLKNIKSYQADCKVIMPLGYGDELKKNLKLTTTFVPTDTLCGFYYNVKDAETNSSSAYFNNAQYFSAKDVFQTTKLIDNPERFKRRYINNNQSFIEAIHKNSFVFDVVPFELGTFIDKSINNSRVIINQCKDTLINGVNCLSYIIEDIEEHNQKRKIELCFHKMDFYPLFYKVQFTNGGYYKIVRFSNTQINTNLGENYFSLTNLFGKNCLSDQRPTMIKIGEKVPDWKLPTLEDSVIISSKSLLGKYVLLEFTATWCGHCIEAVDMMNFIEERFQGNDNFIGLSVFSSEIDYKERIQKFAKDKGINSTILYNAKKASDDFNIYGIPNFFIISPEGKLLMHKDGYSQKTKDEISAFLEMKVK